MRLGTSSLAACLVVVLELQSLSRTMSFVLPSADTSPRRNHLFGMSEDADEVLMMKLPVKPFSSAQRSESASTSSTSISESSSSSSSASSSCSSDKAFDFAHLQQLVQAIGHSEDLDQLCCESVSADMAFCNSVYRVQLADNDKEAKTYFAKLFRPLALGRMAAPLGTMDRLVAQQGLAPEPLAQTDTAMPFE